MDHDDAVSEITSEDDEPEQDVPRRNSKAVRFSAEQLKCLDHAYISKEMTGIGKKHFHLISQAAKDTGLSPDQIKRWIKRTNFMKTHRQIDQNACVQTRRKPKLTKWHAFQKEYGKSDAGKNAMKVGVEKFNKDASAGYKRLSKRKKEKLKEWSDRRAADTVGKIMTPKEIKKAKAKLLKQSKNLLEQWEALGYQGFTFVFKGTDIETTYTTGSACVAKPDVANCIREVIHDGSPSSPQQPPETSDDSYQSDSQSSEAISSSTEEAQLSDMQLSTTCTPPTTSTAVSSHQCISHSLLFTAPTKYTSAPTSSIKLCSSSECGIITLPNQAPQHFPSSSHPEVSTCDSKSFLHLENPPSDTPSSINNNAPAPSPSLHEDDFDVPQSPIQSSTGECSTSQQSDVSISPPKEDKRIPKLKMILENQSIQW